MYSTNKRTPLVLVVFLILIGNLHESCGSGVAKKKKHAIIYCDLSSSVDSNAINEVRKKTITVIRYLPFGSKVDLYPIGANPLSEPLWSEAIPVPEYSHLESSIDEAYRNRDSVALRFANKIIQEYKAKQSIIDKSTRNSCIIGTLPGLADKIKSASKKEYEIEVIYFSDMLECCDLPIKICMEGKHKQSKESIMKVINESNELNFNLNNMIGNHIYIIQTSNFFGRKDCLSEGDVKYVWKYVFGKMGYSEEEFENIHFGTNIPSIFEEWDQPPIKN